MNDTRPYKRIIWWDDPGVSQPTDFSNQATRMWDTFKEMSSDQTKKIGEKVIDGRAALGFKMAIKPYEYPWASQYDGFFEVWVDRETAEPIQAITQFTDSRGETSKDIIQDIQWNIPLADELFQPPPDRQGIEHEHLPPVKFTRKFLQDGVTLRVGPPGQKPVLTEANVLQISGGERFIERSNNQEIRRITVNVHIDQEAKDSLYKYTQEHVEEVLSIDFNGDFKTGPMISGPVLTSKLPINITDTNLTLEQFEQKYLKEK